MKSLAAAIALAGIAWSVTGSHAADLRGARLFKSGPIQITSDGSRVWCVNPDNDSISRIELPTGTAAEFPLPKGPGRHAPRGLSIKEDGSEIWVACHDSDQVCVFDADGVLLASIEMPWGSGPFSVALAPNQESALVTLHRGEALAVLDVPTRRVSHLLKHVFWAPMGIAWAEGGNAAWVTHIFSPGEHPLQTRVDFSGPEPRVSTAMRILPADPRHAAGLAAPYNVPEGGYLNIRGHPAQIPSASGRNELWLPTQYHNMTADVASPDATVQSVVRHLNLATRTLLTANADKVIMTALHVHNPTGNGAYLGPGWNAGVAGPIDIAFSVDGQMVYVLNELSRDLVVMPVSTSNLRPTGAPPLTQIQVGDRPIGVAVSPAASNAYVLNQLTRDVSVVNLASQTEVSRIPLTPTTGEGLPPNVLLGAQLFHTSDDPRISKSGKMACGSCHINAEHDGRIWQNQFLPGSHGPRATPGLLGLRLTMGPPDESTGFGQLHRSGDRDELQDFEHTFQGPQMGGSGFLGETVNPELGAPNAGRSAELDAIADYLLFLDPLWRSPHREANGAMTEAAIRGATFFAGTNRVARRGDAGCATCHIPESGFTDFKFHNVGQRRDAAEKELNNRTPAWSVNTPSLVGAWATAPYVGTVAGGEGHSAREDIIGFLRDAVGRSNTSTNHGRPDGLTQRQLRDLAEFVLSIDGDMTAAEVRGARDTMPPRVARAEITSLCRIDVWFNETVKSGSAANPANWSLTTAGGIDVPISGTVFDGQNGDHVILVTTLQPHTAYTLVPGPGIFDDADAASGNTANAVDPSDPVNRRSLVVEDRLTITLGASGYENLTIPVHDSAMVGPNLATWSHDSVWLSTAGSGPGFTTAFVRFDWVGAFRAVCGVTNAGQIVDARFELSPELGDSQRIDLRRCLQRWSDPPTGGDFNSNPTGGPTWNSSAHGSKAWNLAGAARLGSNGATTNDYFGANDLASRVDASVVMLSITEPTEFGGPLVTEGFRFWFDNPAHDYGYALRLVAGSRQETKFNRWESAFRESGPVLKITYLVPGAMPRLDAIPMGSTLRLQWPVEHSGFGVETAVNLDGGWDRLDTTISSNAVVNYVDVPAPAGQTFFRLTNP